MSNWKLLEQYRVTKPSHNVLEKYVSDSSYGFNGMFRLPNNGQIVRCIASDGTDSDGPEWKWQHVSVSIEGDSRPPRWSVMCWVKNLFWEPEDVVMQLHPRTSEYVNFHPACLHLWRPLPPNPPIPEPLAIMVGPRRRPTPATVPASAPH